MSDIKNLRDHQKAAFIIAVIVALADAVIVYDLHLSGAWLTPSWLSWLKTTAFVLLFIGSLIAEMQELQRRTRILLLVGVILLGGYQAATNVVVNFHAASIPQSAVAFFQPWLDAVQVKFWYSVVDGSVRTTVVVLMWLVTGLVWRGVAVHESASGEEVAALQEKLATAEDELATAQTRLQETEADLDAARRDVQVARTAVQAADKFGDMPRDMQIKWMKENRNGSDLTNKTIADIYGIAESTVSRK